MGKVFLNPQGDGSAYCIPAAGTELSNNERFEIHFVPFSGASLDSVRAFDSHDYAVALPTVSNNTITMNFRSAWGNLYVDVYFSGSPTPPTPTIGFIWLWLKMAKLKRKRRNLT